MPTYTLYFTNAYSIPWSGMGTAWSNPTNVLPAGDGTTSDATNSGGTTQYLQVQTFASLPSFSSNEVLQSLVLHVIREDPGPPVAPLGLTDVEVHVVKAGVQQSSINYAQVSTNWPSTLTQQDYTVSSTDLASLGISIADLSGAFGFDIRATNNSDSSLTASIDSMWMTVNTAYVGPYIENPQVSLGITPSETDTFSTSGPQVYHESPVVNLAITPSENDTFKSPNNSYTPTLGLVIFPSVARTDGGPFTFSDAPSLNLTLIPSAVDTLRPFEFPSVSLNFTPSEADDYFQASDLTYYEFPNVSLVLTVSQVDQAAGNDSPSVGMGFGEAGGNHSAYHISVSVSAIETPSQHDAGHLPSSVSVSQGLTAAETDKGKLRESGVAVSSANTPAASSHASPHDSPAVRSVLTASESGIYQAQSTAAVSQGFSLKAGDTSAQHPAASVSSIFTPGVNDRIRTRDAGAVSLGSTPASSNPGKASTYAVQVPVVFGLRATDHLTHSENPAVSLSFAFPVLLPAMQASGLIPSIRYHVSQSIEGLTAIVEGLPDEVQGDSRDLQLPYVCIIAGKPTYRDAAVNSLQCDLEVDVVYVTRNRTGLDTPQSMRSDLAGVIKALLADYKQTGNTGVPSALYTYVAATPMERVSQYQEKFSAAGEPVVVQSITLQFATEGFS